MLGIAKYPIGELFEGFTENRSEALAYEGIYGPRLVGVKDEILAKIYIVPRIG